MPKWTAKQTSQQPENRGFRHSRAVRSCCPFMLPISLFKARSTHNIAQRQDTLATAGARSIWRSRWHVRAGGRSSAYRRRARSTACVSARWRLLTPSSPAPSWCCGRLRAKTTRGLHLGCAGPKLLNRRAYRHCQPTEPDGSHLRGPGWPRPNFSSFSHGKVDPPQHFHRISAHKVI